MVGPVYGQVVVIVGASSGIGRLAARRFADQGAHVVVAARDGAALDGLADELVSAGGSALAVATDVTSWDEVADLARRTEERFGRIDTWINGAAVAVYGEVAEVPVEELVRVIDVDLVGQVHGVKAALPIMRRQGGGTIIGISSVLGVRAVPMQAAYCAAKHGVVGFYDAVRLEERRAGTGVRVTTVLPSSINTPFFDAARSHMGVRPAPIPPVYQPEAVVDALVHAAERPVRQVVVGGGGAQVALLQRLSPAVADRLLLLGDQGTRRQRRSTPDHGEGSLDRPPAGPRRAHGEFGRWALPRSAYTRVVAQHAGPARAATVAALAAAAGWCRRPARA